VYTITFDETSNFEALIDEHESDIPAMLCGFVYNDKSEKLCYQNGEPVEPERARITEYYKAVCRSAKTVFPRDLHYNTYKKDEEKDEYEDNKKQVSATKAEISETIGEFIMKGTYKKKPLLYIDKKRNIVTENDGTKLPRKGNYQLVTVLRTPESSAESTGNALQRDDIASNLYLNMIEEFIKKSLFYNLNITDDLPVITFNLPTRTLSGSKVQDEENYDKYGYGSYKARDQKRINITDSSHYHALITQCSKYRPIEVKELHVNNSYYPLTASEIAPKQEYLYLADSLCACLSFHVRKPQDLDIITRMNKYNNPKRNLFFYYQGTNDCYDQAVDAFLKQDIFATLGAVYDGERILNTTTKEYHKKKYFSIIEKKLLKTATTENLHQAIEKLSNYRFADNLDQRKLLALLKKMEELIQTAEIDKQHQFILADTGITAYTHIGDPKKAEEYYHRCMELKDTVGADDIQRVEIRYITTLNDMLRFKQARNQALGIFGIQLEDSPKAAEPKKGLIRKALAKLFPNTQDNNIEEPESEKDQVLNQLPESVSKPNMFRALSSLGQTYAFMNDSLADDCFLKAINDIDNLQNRNITESYFLHYLIESNRKEDYKTYAADYFNGITDLNEQLEYLIREGSKSREQGPKFSLGYALYVYIKAFYVFYKDDLQNIAVTRKLVNIRRTICSLIKNGPQFMNGHPWELIFKYAAMLVPYAYFENGEAVRSDNKQLAKAAVGPQPGFIIEKIMEYGDIEILAQGIDKSWRAHMNSRINKLWSSLVLNGAIIQDETKQISTEEKLQELKTLFTYMYH